MAKIKRHLDDILPCPKCNNIMEIEGSKPNLKLFCRNTNRCDFGKAPIIVFVHPDGFIYEHV